MKTGIVQFKDETDKIGHDRGVQNNKCCREGKMDTCIYALVMQEQRGMKQKGNKF